MNTAQHYYPYAEAAANPFIASGGAKEWEGNELILKDPILRKKARMIALDECVTDVYAYSTVATPPVRVQLGGAASGAPFYIENFGASGAAPYAPAFNGSLLHEGKEASEQPPKPSGGHGRFANPNVSNK